jgi:hypothetical protein
MEGDLPLIFGLMAVSSLIFGGLHCLAWNFEFPTQAELISWRIASLASAILPATSLATSVFLSFLATSYATKEFISSLLASLGALDQFPVLWWQLIFESPKFASWSQESSTVFFSMPPGSRDWDKEPSNQLFAQLEAEGKVVECQRKRDKLKNYWRHMEKFATFWVVPREGRLGPNLRDHLMTLCGSIQSDTGTDISGLWREYEQHLKLKFATYGLTAPDIKCRDFIVNLGDEFNQNWQKMQKLSWRCNQASQFLTISSSILYIAARLIILILLFTSLRSVPEGV